MRKSRSCPVNLNLEKSCRVKTVPKLPHSILTMVQETKAGSIKIIYNTQICSSYQMVIANCQASKHKKSEVQKCLTVFSAVQSNHVQHWERDQIPSKQTRCYILFHFLISVMVAVSLEIEFLLPSTSQDCCARVQW